MVNSSIKSRAKFDINNLSPIDHVDKCFIPVIFAHGNQDNFILPHHSEDLLKKYAGDKKLMKFDGDHNSNRPDHFLDAAVIFLYQRL
jgi:hypothetical protein